MKTIFKNSSGELIEMRVNFEEKKCPYEFIHSTSFRLLFYLFRGVYSALLWDLGLGPKWESSFVEG